MKLLPFCLALGLGEALASATPQCAPVWPVCAIIAALILLLGHGCAVRMWPLSFAFALGLALFFHASVDAEFALREKPWLRDRNARNHDWALATPVRAELSGRMAIGLSERCETVSLNRAILLGERRRMSAATKRVFLESGTIHLFAISGLHVMVIAKTLAIMLALAFVPLRWAGVCALPPLWAYVTLIEAPPSAVRAALMASVHFLAPALWRRPDAFRAWSLTFLATHVIAPTQIADTGSLLSFTVMLALLTAERIARTFAGDFRRLVFVTCIAWAAGTPIAAHFFGRVTPGGILANLLLISSAGYSVAAGAIGILASFVSTRLAGYVNNLSALFTEVLVAVARIVAHLPVANVDCTPWSVSSCLVWYALLAFGLWYMLCRRRNGL